MTEAAANDAASRIAAALVENRILDAGALYDEPQAAEEAVRAALADPTLVDLICEYVCHAGGPAAAR